jgi:4-diphosphocytidyl-2-C-methyl-D-erythritol kinase
MSILSETAFAKLNLALHVRRRRDDGYHELETLFAFVDAGDHLTASVSDKLELTVSGPFGDGLGDQDENLVLRTAKLLQRTFDVKTGAILTLEKKLPVASGIGGGSADAAATARLLNRLWNLGASEIELATLLAPLGADIPACVMSKTAIGAGTGTELCAVGDDALSGTPVLLVNPLLPVSTAAIFRTWDEIDRGGLGDGNAIQIAQSGRNDLEPMAVDICPAIAVILQALESTSPILSRMSGSGATCFALYKNVDALRAATFAMSASWWTLEGRLR